MSDEAAGTVLPEPYEGTLRDTDDLLSLEDKAMPRRRMMIMMALSAYRATLVGNPAPITEKMGERIRNPQPGDLVVETTKFRRDSEHGFGILLARRREPWSAGADEEVWYIQYGPGERDIARWTNCDFIAALTEKPEQPPQERS